MRASEWIDRVKAARGWESDYRAAKELGLSKATVSAYRSRSPTMDEDVAVKVAEALGEPPEIIILDQAAERSRSDEARSAIMRALARISAAGLAAFTIGAGGLAAPSPAPAQTIDSTSLSVMSNNTSSSRNVYANGPSRGQLSRLSSGC